MLKKGVVNFLRRHPPFCRLDDQVLTWLADNMKMEIYPAGSEILSQGASASGDLRIIEQGMVKIHARTAPGHEPDLDFRGEGETFGFLSRGSEGWLDVSVQAVRDTVCYVIEGIHVERLLAEHPGLEEFFVPSFFPRREDLPYGPLPAADILHEGSERILFTTLVRDLASRPALTVGRDLPVGEAARLMSLHRSSILVVLSDAGLPAGVVTTADLRDRVLAQQRAPSVPVGEIMTSPPVSVEEETFCYEALLKMMNHGIHHLLVTDAGAVAGTVSSDDFMTLQGTSPLIIVREIEGQTTVEGLAVSARRVLSLVSLLLGEGAGAGSIIRIITNVNDRVELKILEIAERVLGPPPLPWSWIVYGSAGRREQTFKTDQDNAIIYQDPGGEEESRKAEEYFGRFAEFAVDASLRCGFARCQGGYMATNPAWRQPLSTWKKYFLAWIGLKTGKAVYNAANFFDFRWLHGDRLLAGVLKEHLMNSLPDRPLFLKAMADMARDYRPPLGLFGALRVEKEGDHAHTLDIKKSCLMPLVNVVRLFSLEMGIPETSTAGRIAALKKVHSTVAKVGDDLAHAFEFLALLRIRHQHDRISMNLEPDNFINPKRLGSLERRNLKEASRLVGHVIEGIARRYDVSRQI